MGTTFRQMGKTGTFPAPSGGVVKDRAYFWNGLASVALETAAAGVNAEFALEGVFELAADNADTFDIGEIVYWDAGNNRVTVVSTGNTILGRAFENKATPTVVKVKIGPGLPS